MVSVSLCPWSRVTIHVRNRRWRFQGEEGIFPCSAYVWLDAGGSKGWKEITLAGDPSLGGGVGGHRHALAPGTQDLLQVREQQEGRITCHLEVSGNCCPGGVWHRGSLQSCLCPQRHLVRSHWEEQPREPGFESGGSGEPCALSEKTVIRGEEREGERH